MKRPFCRIFGRRIRQPTRSNATIAHTFVNTATLAPHDPETMKTTILATLLSAAAAFAPAKQAVQTTSLSAFENELGAQEPLGFWYVVTRERKSGRR